MKWAYLGFAFVWAILGIVNWWFVHNTLLGNSDFIIAIGLLILAKMENKNESN